MTKPVTPEVAAEKAGYKQARLSGWQLMHNPMVREAVRSEARKFLDEKGGAIGVYVLASIAVDEAQPSGARVKAAEILGKWGGMAGDEDLGSKEPHEMTIDELRTYRRQLEHRRQGVDRALSDQAQPVIDHDESSVFD